MKFRAHTHTHTHTDQVREYATIFTIFFPYMISMLQNVKTTVVRKQNYTKITDSFQRLQTK